MQLRHLKPIMPQVDGICKVTALAFSPNNKRLAVVTVDRVVHLFDETGERRDKFSTKPADKGPKSYTVESMAFSPDSSKLAVAQSDNIVFVYKLGVDWGDRKSICNKFPQTSAVTCLAWPTAHPNEVVFGLQEGKVKIGQLRSNKPATLYPTDSYVVTLCCSPDGNAILSAHVDGSIYRFNFEDGVTGPSHAKFAQHPCVPYALCWGHSIMAAGNDAKVVFYDLEGSLLRTFDYSSDSKVKEFSCAVANPSGEAVVVGNFDKFFIYSLNSRTNEWEDAGVKEVRNMYTVSALAWKPDGSRLAVGGLCGVVDLYDACIRRTRYRGKFEFTYVSLSQVIVKRLSSGTRIVLKSHYGCEILKINIFQDRYLVAHTPETLLMGDLETCKLSEVPWTSSGAEKFFFDNAHVCMVFNAGQLSIIEYGRNELLGTCRTEHMNPHLISVRINERPPARDERAGGAPASDENKKIAYLLDVQTIRVLDLVSGITTATINHDTRIDWLELNGRGNLVLFRDKRRKLHLFDIAQQQRTTLLNFCNYVQWVPESDVVVAQNRNNLCVWYNIAAPDKVTIYQIKGDVEEIERSHGKTEVVVDEGVNTASYILDEGLIGFGTAIEDRDLERAISILENLALTPETEAMWNQLSGIALREGNLHTAQRCAAALGDVSKARFLMKTSKIAIEAESKMGGDARDYWMVRARMAQLRGDLDEAEAIFCEQGQVNEAIDMYHNLHMWDRAIQVAEGRGLQEATEMRRQYFQYLLDTRQEEKAAALKEQEQDLVLAIDLYLRGGFPARAMQVVLNSRSLASFSADLLNRVVAALLTCGLFEKAGTLLERMDEPQRAMEAYIKGNAFRAAVDLARRRFPGQVVQLEQAWGDWLVSQRQVDAAISHYIEAGAHVAAINAALNSKQFARAVQMVDRTLRDPEVAKPIYRRIAKHYQENGQLEEAEQYYVKAGCPRDAVEMYANANRLEAAHKLAVACMDETEVARLYIEQARRQEAEGKFKEAEKLFITVNEPDLAISMYKKAKKYDQMIRLVGRYRKDLLKETHLHLAQQLEMEGSLKEAENHYCEATEWESAVNMYRSNDMWEDAFRVAKFQGGAAAGHRVAYAWALSLGGEAGSKLLDKLGLIEQAIDYAIDSGAFDHAFQLARSSMKKKLPEVHLKHALFLEDEGRFKEAESEFIKAEKPKEAIDMYIHQQDWKAAMRVAESFDPSSVPDVLVAQGRAAADAKDWARASSFFVDAHKPELALRMYMESRQFPEALRIAKKHLPHKIHEINREIQRLMSDGDHGPAAGGAAGGGGGGSNPLSTARMFEDSRDFGLAIDAYMSVTQAHVGSQEELISYWLRAVRLADEHDKRQYAQVAGDVARKLFDMGQFARAADLYKSLDQIREAIDCYIRAQDWDSARALAKQGGPQLQQHVNKAYQAAAMRSGDTTALVGSGNVEGAVEVFIRKGEWNRVFETVSQQAPQALTKFALQYAEQALQKRAVAEMVDMFARYGPPVAPASVPLFKQIVRQLFSGNYKTTASAEVLGQAREVMYKLVSQMRRAADVDKEGMADLEQHLLIVHFAALRGQCRALGLGDIAARLSVSLLRYAGIIPADRAFYEAGISCREQSWMSMAFVMLNRYLDIADEAMESGSLEMLDNTDFMHTDIPPPHKFGVPSEQFLSDEKKEEVRDWVLTLSTDAANDQTLPVRPCEVCRNEIFEGCLKCNRCQTVFPSCIVTGYPIPAAELVACTACSTRAYKPAWNAYLMKTHSCPWCNAAQNPVY